MKKTMTAALAVLAGALALAACGDDGDSGDTATAAPGGLSTTSGEFEMASTAPKGTGKITGTAELVRTDGGTVAKLEVSGLEPGVDYISHVHVGNCDQPDPGGPHFKFDLNGSDMPPNEIHLPLTADENGNGSAEVTSESTVPPEEGPSIVLHLADEGGHSMASMDESADDGHSHSHAPKLACAQLS